VIEDPDIIIIGLGTAGSVLARRLNDALPRKRILVLEQGMDLSSSSTVYNVFNGMEAAYNTNFSSVLPVDNPNVKASVGKMFGGSSSHNFGLTVHGSPWFYENEWCPILNLPYQDMIPYIKGIERYSGTTQSPMLRGLNGMIEVSQLPVKATLHFEKLLSKVNTQGLSLLWKAINIYGNLGPLRASDKFSKVFIDSLTNISPNLEIVKDYNVVNNCICVDQQLFVDPVTGIRQSVDISYLPDTYRLRNKGKLDIRGGCQVDKILHNGIGVIYNGGIIQKLKPNGRIIVCGGGIFSPHLLLKSGFKNSYIGRNLKTHYGSQIIMSIEADDTDNFNFSGGPIAFLPLNTGDDLPDKRDLQILVSGGPLLNTDLLKVVGIDFNAERIKNPRKRFFCFIVWTLRPNINGSVELNENDNSLPVIKLNMFENTKDSLTIIKAIKGLYAVALGMKQTYSSLKVVFPPENAFNNGGNDRTLFDYVKKGISMTDHYSCTCALGKVVNPKDFALYEDPRTHVVDASVFPAIADGNTEYPVCLMAEIAADRIISSIISQ